ncbi:MAG: SDR family NAD(P)-dependent oxidoreductase, partial [Bacteroidales bacterium]
MKKFKDKVVWITGASSGIGEACAYCFAGEGAILVLTALEADQLERVKQKCLDGGASDVALLPFDLSDLDRLEQLGQEALACFGRIDILYNN